MVGVFISSMLNEKALTKINLFAENSSRDLWRCGYRIEILCLNVITSTDRNTLDDVHIV